MSSVFIPGNGSMVMPAYGAGSVYSAPGHYPMRHAYPPSMPVQRYYGPAPMMMPSYGSYPMPYNYGASPYYGHNQPATVIIPSSRRHRRSSSSHHRRSRSRDYY
ncbi:hypothetical protein HGRIS_010848 [Hohenbuehelia grisea]|uniref:Uncharacterized protein n=1 Tax=Hohenbuehelia grisea TaxID=104357 RepID=A0ABR3IYH0_9AGAR